MFEIGGAVRITIPNPCCKTYHFDISICTERLAKSFDSASLVIPSLLLNKEGAVPAN